VDAELKEEPDDGERGGAPRRGGGAEAAGWRTGTRRRMRWSLSWGELGGRRDWERKREMVGGKGKK
jgi:hypothetical protein